MGVDTEWDVEKYFSAHEPKHHWELRKQFMINNKGRYDEERLVCLAQTFANIEFMGCRYPKETMELVEEMAYGIVQNYREEQKNRLQRTFVSGADAAGAKVNKLKKAKTTILSHQECKLEIKILSEKPFLSNFKKIQRDNLPFRRDS